MSQVSTNTLDVGNLICGLKTAVTALECQHKMELRKQLMDTKKSQISAPPPVYMMIPIEEKKSHHKIKNRQNSRSKSSSCCVSKIGKELKKSRSRTSQKEEEMECVFVSPEMRAGVLYTKCECLLRNGLQDSCPLTLCQGQPDCLVHPWAECPPGKYFRERYPEVYRIPPDKKTE